MAGWKVSPELGEWMGEQRRWVQGLDLEQLQSREVQARLLGQAVRDAFLQGDDQNMRLHIVVLRQLLDGGPVEGTVAR